MDVATVQITAPATHPHMATPKNLSQQLQPAGKPDDRLFAILKTKLTGEEQQLFVDGFSVYLSSNPTTEFVVSFEFTYEWLGFTRGNAKRMIKNTLTLDVDYKNLLLRPQEQVPNTDATGRNLGGAGLNKETILLTVNGFKMFCMMAGTEKAKRVRMYYIAIERVMFEYTRAVLEDAEFAKAYSRHQALIACNDAVGVVYMGQVTLNGVHYVKPGHTIDARQRGSMLRTEYGPTFVFAEVLPCDRAHQYEQWLLNDSELTRFRCTVTLDGHNKTELIRLSAGVDGLTKEHAAKVMREHIGLFRNSEETNRTLQMRFNLIATLTANGSTPEQIAPLLGAMPAPPPPPPPQQQGGRVQGLNNDSQVIQQYTLEGALVKVHDSIRNAVRSVPGASVYAIVQAAKENFAFKGFRWLEVDHATRYNVRELPPVNNFYAHVNGQSTIAQIDAGDLHIVRTFGTLESAAAAVGLRTAATLTSAIGKGARSKGFLWKRYDDCDPERRAAFVAAGGVVVPPTPRAGKKTEQVDAVSGEVARAFNTLQDACIAMQGSHKAFHKAVKNNEVYKGFKWRFS